MDAWEWDEAVSESEREWRSRLEAAEQEPKTLPLFEEGEGR